MPERAIRPSWKEYFLAILRTTQLRATCNRGKSAALLVKDNRILSTGYVGSPAGMVHCDEAGHEWETWFDRDDTIYGWPVNPYFKKQRCVRTIHAEQNAIAWAARKGVPIEGSTLYVTMVPCYSCAKLLVQSGIVSVVADYDYRDTQLTLRLFKAQDISCEIIHRYVPYTP